MIKTALKDLFSLKETYAILIGLAMYFSGKYAIGLSQTDLWVVAGAVMMLVTHGAIATAVTGAASQNARLTLLERHVAMQTYDRATARTTRDDQKGAASLRTLTMLSVFAMISVALLTLVGCAWWSTTGSNDAKTAGHAGETCAVSDAEKYATQFFVALASEGYTKAVDDLKTSLHLTQDLTNCVIRMIMAVESPPTNAPSTSQPTPVVLHAQAYLAAH